MEFPIFMFFLSSPVAELESAYAENSGMTARVIERERVTIAGVNAVRVVLDMKHSQTAMRQVQYLVPGGNDWYAIMTFATVPSAFEAYRPIFEAAVSQTQGLRAPQSVFNMEALNERFTRLGGWFLGFLIAVLALRQKLKKPDPPPRRGYPARRPPSRTR